MSSSSSKGHDVDIKMNPVGSSLEFQDFDDESVYRAAMDRAQSKSTKNLVVEFGREEVRIAFDIDAKGARTLLEDSIRPAERPVRWINIWGPGRQTDFVESIASHYKFSPRLLAIMRTASPDTRTPTENPVSGRSTRLFHKNDIETAAKKLDIPDLTEVSVNHYSIASAMINYASVDIGSHFLCVGANWMHELPPTEDDYVEAMYKLEGRKQRLWSWLVLCDDSTVISLHEDFRPADDTTSVKYLRGNVISIMSQLSHFGYSTTHVVSMQNIRPLRSFDDANPGVEASSLLFYYLFDDWRAVYGSVAGFRQDLLNLRNIIIRDMATSKSAMPHALITPRLHMLGLRIRQMHSLHEAYLTTIQRILEPRSNSANNSGALSSNRIGVVLSPSAAQRFERLADRIQILILSPTPELLSEKDALIASYFNTLARKDSEATIRLTSAATLLAKLSVLFLPVSLMTSYFSIQISDLQGVYTAKEYWYAFAGVMGVSFLGVFFFSSVLMFVSESLDTGIRRALRSSVNFVLSPIKKAVIERAERRRAMESLSSYSESL